MRYLYIETNEAREQSGLHISVFYSVTHQAWLRSETCPYRRWHAELNECALSYVAESACNAYPGKTYCDSDFTRVNARTKFKHARMLNAIAPAP